MRPVLTLLLVAILLQSCESANNQRPPAQYEEKKASLEEIERDSPLKFLKVSAFHRGNLVNQTVVKGEVINKATLTTYKDVQISITFLDKEGTVIEKEKETLSAPVSPGETNEFKIKTGHVKGASSVTVDIVKAIADK
ncbi:MAG: FxLYD domain-containing protein [Bacteroidota bacterium]